MSSDMLKLMEQIPGKDILRVISIWINCFSSNKTWDILSAIIHI